MVSIDANYDERDNFSPNDNMQTPGTSGIMGNTSNSVSNFNPISPGLYTNMGGTGGGNFTVSGQA